MGANKRNSLSLVVQLIIRTNYIIVRNTSLVLVKLGRLMSVGSHALLHTVVDLYHVYNICPVHKLKEIFNLLISRYVHTDITLSEWSTSE